jgi:hypothetical protein
MAYGDQFAPNNYANVWLAKKQARKHADEQKRQQGAVRIDGQLEALLPHIEVGNVAAMRKAVDLLAKKHRFTVEVQHATTDSDASSYAYAQWHLRKIVIPPIEDSESFSVALHEIGHIVVGECPRSEPHRPDPTVTRWHACLACESDATEVAMRLVPFSPEMHAKLSRCLKTYRRSTPGPESEKERLDRIAGTVFYAEQKQARLKWQAMLERQALAKRRNG